MREPKREKTRLEKLLKTVWHGIGQKNTAATENERRVLAAIGATLRHFEIEDYLHGTRYLEMFKKIYLDDAAKNKTKKIRIKVNSTKKRLQKTAICDIVCIE